MHSTFPIISGFKLPNFVLKYRGLSKKLLFLGIFLLLHKIQHYQIFACYFR
jgi:hypothetical protein